MIRRNIEQKLRKALADRPVVLLNGARQTGKSTLAQWLSQEGHPSRYITLDDATMLASARNDPTGFLSGMEGPVILDEVQLVPGLFRAIKLEVDRNRAPGRFLLTGSANVLLLPQLSESLAGRMEIHTLWPFSMGELHNCREHFIDMLFSKGNVPQVRRSCSRRELFAMVQTGGFPEVTGNREAHRRAAWQGSYITTILQRDVRELSNIEYLAAMPRLLSLLALRSMMVMNYSEISRTLGLAQNTLKRYLTLLETAFLIQTLPPWSANLGKRLVKASKMVLTDTGLASYLIGVAKEELEPEHPMTGPLLENFVAMELYKQTTWCDASVRLYHFRVQSGQEVDIIMEDAAGRVAGIEVKSSAAVTPNDFRHLRYLEETLGDRFVRGVVLYTGEETVPFEPKLTALPITALWDVK